MPLYESVFIARQEISASAAEALADKYSDLLKENGGTVAKREYWGLRTLAYRIKKNRKGHYFLFNVDAPWKALEEMDRLMRIDDDLLRHLTVKVEEHEEEPSVMMQTHDRDDRPARTPYGSRDRNAKPDENKAKVTEAPVESAPAENAPTESAPAESAPAESAPAESAPAESAPAESAPAESA
ncbi:MAG: 30S ribosomal protein S6, partial [Rhodospirillaceae bacterium]|nr:30S ribosomal protein S6 [Rhodospirillaceae bacterium]